MSRTQENKPTSSKLTVKKGESDSFVLGGEARIFLKRSLFEKERAEWERAHKWGWGAQSGRSRLLNWGRSLTPGSISEPWDHDLSQRQMLNWLSHLGAPFSEPFENKLHPWCLTTPKYLSVYFSTSRTFCYFNYHITLHVRKSALLENHHTIYRLLYPWPHPHLNFTNLPHNVSSSFQAHYTFQ